MPLGFEPDAAGFSRARAMCRPSIIPPIPCPRRIAAVRRSRRAHVDPFELDGQRVVRALGDAVEGRGGRSDLAEQLALGDPGQPLAGPFQALRADVDAVVQLEVDHRDDGRVGHAVDEHALGVLHGVPALGIGAADKPADLDVVEWQLGLAEIGADRRDEVARRPWGRPSQAPPMASLSP